MLSKTKTFIIAYIGLLLIFIVSLFLTSSIPSSALQKQIDVSVTELQKEGTYPSFGLPSRKVVLDNFTDPLMINTAYSLNSEEAFKSMLLNKRYSSSTNSTDQIQNLAELYEKNNTPQTGYERYWHGYLIYLRPLLTMFSYSGIRVLNALFLYCGFVWLLVSVWKKLGRKMVIALLVGFVATDFFFIWKSLQFSAVFHVAIYSSIYFLSTYKKSTTYYVFFFIVGGITAFFDLLTVPLITLGLPLILYVALEKRNVWQIIRLCFIWTAGYLLLWASKWVLVQYFFVPGAIHTSIDQIVNRTVTKADPDFNHINTIKRNILQLLGYDKMNKIIDLVIAGVMALFFLRYVSFRKVKLQNVIPWMIIGGIPYAWYLVAANHSYLHVWYTYRLQLISVICFVLIYMEFIDWKKVKKEFRII